jgi:hypothetical protein
MRRFPKYTDSDIDKDMRLTRSDYIKIISHYRRRGDSRPMRTASLKERAHDILAGKLCRCINPNTATAAAAPMMTRARKRRESIEKSRRIAYCTQSIFNNRGLRRHGFRCKTARSDKLRPHLTGDITKSAQGLGLGH